MVVGNPIRRFIPSQRLHSLHGGGEKPEERSRSGLGGLGVTVGVLFGVNP